MWRKASAIALLCLVTETEVAWASQDSAYYPQSYGNPNTRINNLYYREAVNVLQDLQNDEFSALFVRYHGCVWSEYGGYYDQQNNDNNRGDGGEEYYNDAGCLRQSQAGGDENENNGNGQQQWYIGATQCFRPNVAFSLYGVKKGHKVSSKGACTSNHYVNSFFTRYGIESWGNAVGFNYANFNAFTTCKSNNGEEQDDANNYGYYQNHGGMFNADTTSYGLACNSDGGFVTAKFAGSYCSGDYFLGVMTTYNEMNKALENEGCLMIYNDGEVSFENSNHEAYYKDTYLNSNAAWNLLENSVACSTYEYPDGQCPDPFNKKHLQESTLIRVATIEKSDIPKAMPIITVIMIVLSIGVLIKTHILRNQIIRHSLQDDLMDQARGVGVDPSPAVEKNNSESWMNFEVLSKSFSRSMTGLTNRSYAARDALMKYAEEEEDEIFIQKQAVFSALDEDMNNNDDLISVSSKKSVAASVSSKTSVAASVSSKKSGISYSSKGSTSSKRSDAVPSEDSTTFESSKNLTTEYIIMEVGVDADRGGGEVVATTTTTTTAAEEEPNGREIGQSDATEEEGDDISLRNKEIADALLVEKGMTPSLQYHVRSADDNDFEEKRNNEEGLPPLHPSSKKSASSGGKRYKRPRMAKISKLFFGKRSKSSSSL